MSIQHQFLAPFGHFQFLPADTPFYYTVTLDGRPLGFLALRFGHLEALRQFERGGDDPYYISELQWNPVESIACGLKYLAEGAEERFPGLNINEAFRAAQRLNAYNATANVV